VIRLCAWIMFFSTLLAASGKTVRISVYPQQANLTGDHTRQSLLVMAVDDEGVERDVTAKAAYTTTPAGIVRVTTDFAVEALADGAASLRVAYGDKQVEAKCAVTNQATRRPVSFLGDIAPILTERGCTGSNCHGSVRGKAGFKLSLFGARPDLDYEAITKANDGRRLNVAKPEESLILAKPTMRIAHGGGQRFKINSQQYDLILRWVKSGAVYDTGTPQLESVRVQPPEQILVGTDAKQRLVVTGKYSDGSEVDLTQHVRYSSNDDTTASVNDDGLVTAKRRGETAIMIRIQGKTTVARIAVIPTPAGPDYPVTPSRNFIDDLVLAKLKRLNITPSALSEDQVFVRRVYLDTLGTLPTADETRRFLADSNPEKRARLIDELLTRPEFTDLWALKFADLYQLGGTGLKGGWQLYRWIRQSLDDRKPYDQMVREMATGGGSFVYNATPNFYAGLFLGPEGMVTQVSQSLLGVRMDCAKCHDHPFENWTQNDFYSFGAFFTRIVRKAEPYGLFEHSIAIRPTGKPSYDFLGNNKEFLDPKTKQPVTARFLGGESVEFGPDDDVREKLADWITSPRNPFFKRTLVNRVWKHFMNRGLVEPVDDFRVSNPASNPALLDALAAEAVKAKYDLRTICRTILNSRTYQLSAQANSSNEFDNLNYSRYYVKRQMAESLFDNITKTTSARLKIPGSPPGENAMKVAIGSPNYFLTTFGRAGAREQICERDQEATVAQAMHLINGDTIQQVVTKPGNLLDRLLARRDLDDAGRLEEIYLTAFSRPPTPREASNFLELLKSAATDDARKRVYQDLLWAVLNSKEFAYVY
jgi:hypothetical protein